MSNANRRLRTVGLLFLALCGTGCSDQTPSEERDPDGGQVLSDGSCSGACPGEPTGPSLSEWELIRFGIIRSTYPYFIYNHHALTGDITIQIHRDGQIYYLPWQECGGEHPLLVGTLGSERLTMLNDLLTEVRVPESDIDRFLTICSCIHCGSEVIDVQLPNEPSVRLAAGPAFKPLDFCDPSQPLSDTVPGDMVGLSDFLRDIVLELQADDDGFRKAIGLATVKPDAVWLGVFGRKEWSPEYIPPALEWPVGSIDLEALLPTDSQVGYGQRSVEGALAVEVLAACETGRAMWPDASELIGQGTCGPDLFFVATQGDEEYLVACEPALPGELPLYVEPYNPFPTANNESPPAAP